MWPTVEIKHCRYPSWEVDEKRDRAIILQTVYRTLKVVLNFSLFEAHSQTGVFACPFPLATNPLF